MVLRNVDNCMQVTHPPAKTPVPLFKFFPAAAACVWSPSRGNLSHRRVGSVQRLAGCLWFRNRPEAPEISKPQRKMFGLKTKNTQYQKKKESQLTRRFGKEPPKQGLRQTTRKKERKKGFCFLTITGVQQARTGVVMMRKGSHCCLFSLILSANNRHWH